MRRKEKLFPEGKLTLERNDKKWGEKNKGVEEKIDVDFIRKFTSGTG